MNTLELEKILTHLIPPCLCNFLGVFARDTIPHLDDSLTYPLCFVSNTHTREKPGEHWVAFFYVSSNFLEFFDSYGLHPSLYDFTNFSPQLFKEKTLQSLDSNVCGQYCIFFLYHRSRGKSLKEIIRPFSSHDHSSNDKSLVRRLSKYLSFPIHCTPTDSCQSSVKPKCTSLCCHK